jgi:hypothetical protein
MKLGESVLEQKTSYKYLGLEVDQGWKWQQTKARMLEKARKRMATVCALGAETKDVCEGVNPIVGGVSVTTLGIWL